MSCAMVCNSLIVSYCVLIGLKCDRVVSSEYTCTRTKRDRNGDRYRDGDTKTERGRERGARPRPARQVPSRLAGVSPTIGRTACTCIFEARLRPVRRPPACRARLDEKRPNAAFAPVRGVEGSCLGIPTNCSAYTQCAQWSEHLIRSVCRPTPQRSDRSVI